MFAICQQASRTLRSAALFYDGVCETERHDTAILHEGSVLHLPLHHHFLSFPRQRLILSHPHLAQTQWSTLLWKREIPNTRGKSANANHYRPGERWCQWGCHGDSRWETECVSTARAAENGWWVIAACSGETWGGAAAEEAWKSHCPASGAGLRLHHSLPLHDADQETGLLCLNCSETLLPWDEILHERAWDSLGNCLKSHCLEDMKACRSFNFDKGFRDLDGFRGLEREWKGGGRDGSGDRAGIPTV